jgi:2-(1,2-epoxy-1,2-dihydrophenyl)acetyl-CoA isomerase
MTKGLVDQAWQLTLEQVVELETFSQAVSRSTSDHREGLAAFSEKRSSAFTGA